jgi:predicted Zn-dependent protease
VLGLAACRIEQGRAAEALPLIDRMLAANPSSAAALYLRGRVAFELDDHAGAEDWLREATRLAPEDPLTLLLLVQCLRAQGRQVEAQPLADRLEELRQHVRRLEELTRQVARQPDDVHLRYEAGNLALKIGRSEEGVHWLLSALRVKGDHRLVHAALADFYVQHGDTARAETHRRQAELH